MSKRFEARAEPDKLFEGGGGQGAGKLLRGLQETIPQEDEYHERIRARREGWAIGWGRRGNEQFGEYRELGVHGGAQRADVLPGSPRIDAAQCLAGHVGESGVLLSLVFEELHEILAPQGASWDQMFRQHPFRIGQPSLARNPTQDRRDAATPSLSIAFDRKSLGIRVKLKLVMIPAQRAAPLGHDDPDEGDEVLKCVDRRGTLPCSVWGAWVF